MIRILRIVFLFSVILLTPTGHFSRSENPTEISEKDYCYQLYMEMQLNDIINYTAFSQAFAGYNIIEAKNKDILTVIDFSKPSTEERMYVLDLREKKILFSSHVSHGRNSGENYATTFSNKNGSFMSSLGFYLTEGTYQGKNGYSLILNGLEEGINDKAKQRAIVIHGADYCNPAMTSHGHRLGRSLGCPALPHNVCKPIINTIKNGTLLFIYADDKDYMAKSRILATNYRVETS
jgi:hypothetical protein